MSQAMMYKNINMNSIEKNLILLLSKIFQNLLRKMNF